MITRQTLSIPRKSRSFLFQVGIEKAFVKNPDGRVIVYWLDSLLSNALGNFRDRLKNSAMTFR